MDLDNDFLYDAYASFYKSLSNDWGATSSLPVLHFSVDGQLAFRKLYSVAFPHG